MAMFTSTPDIKKLFRFNAAFIILIIVSVISAYASLGITNSGKNIDRPKRNLLSQKSMIKPGTFTLKSGYQFRGGQLYSNQNASRINLNSVATYKVGGTVYTVPLKKQLMLGGKLSVSIQNQVIR